MKHITLVIEYRSACLFMTANLSRCYAKDSVEYFTEEKIVIVIETLDLLCVIMSERYCCFIICLKNLFPSPFLTSNLYRYTDILVSGKYKSFWYLAVLNLFNSTFNKRYCQKAALQKPRYKFRSLMSVPDVTEARNSSLR